MTFSQVAAADWVAQSLAGLTPVTAGRFIVHGAHDRAGVGPNRIGIEIEAALAFGTGHHGTTRGCLLALDDLAKRRRPRNVLMSVPGPACWRLPRRAPCAARSMPSTSTAGGERRASVNARLNRVAAFITLRARGGPASAQSRRARPTI